MGLIMRGYIQATTNESTVPAICSAVKSRPVNRNRLPGFRVLLRTVQTMSVGVLITLASCGPSTETTVVDERARTVEAEDSGESTSSEEDLRELKIGEVNTIHSFDPLFAINTATKRVTMLTYEGLVQYNQNEDIVPAAANRWEVSDDSLTYTFYLRDDLFFHDDQSFAQGRGRRVNSSDVVGVFERMASRDVPPDAAELFMNSIRGFEAYYLEQREIYIERAREITDIQGIEAINDTTIAFQLLEPDRDFLKKLSSPYAVIYPSEPFQFRDDGLHRHPVGTGPFSYESSVGDSLYIFGRNDSYNRVDGQGRQLPRTHRLELLNITNETRLYSHFTRERLNIIAELGPQSVNSLVNDDNQLNEDLPEQYRLETLDNPDPVVLQYNDRNHYGLGRSDAAAVIRNIDQDYLRRQLGYPTIEISYIDSSYSQSNIGRLFQRFGEDQQNRLTFAFNQDHLPRLLSGTIRQVMDENLQVELVQRRVFSREIFLYLDYLHTYIPGQIHERQPNEVMRIETDRYMLYDHTTDGIRTNSLSWWIDLNHARTHQPPQ